MALCGFSVHGIVDTLPDLAGVAYGTSRSRLIRESAQEQARLTSACGGNAIRVFYSNVEICGAAVDPRPHSLSTTAPDPERRSWHLFPRAEKLRQIRRIHEELVAVAKAVEVTNDRGDGLNFADLDDYLEGIRSFNRTQPDVPARVRVLLTNVIGPPRPILECPSDGDLAWGGLPFTFDDLYAAYCSVHAHVARKMVNRYAAGPGEDPLVVAFELNNEPDYEWLPDEQRIEWSTAPATMPLTKYITELHPAQVPDRYAAHRYAEATEWGGYQEQSGNWAPDPGVSVAALEFNWGPKYDWYIRCYAEWAKQVSFAFHDEGRKRGLHFDIVSAGVTHNNVDFLVRLHRANPEAFSYCTIIAFHPYHWPDHNIHDTTFKDRVDFSDWKSRSPRELTGYFKCFDFFKVFNEFIEDRRRIWPGFRGKRIWLTEFGLGTKLHGLYNSVNPQFVPFIRPRRIPAESLPGNSAVWEDIWEAFLSTITPEYLHALNVEGMFFYALREMGTKDMDKHDDDRTNFAIMDRYGQPRMGRQVFGRLSDLMCGMTGRRREEELDWPLTPVWARWKEFSLPLLRSEPWRYIEAPPRIFETMSMLSEQEKRLLYWSTAYFYQGRGEIVDGGCFVGGSTVALARGLADHWPEDRFKVHTYDLFLADGYMDRLFFRPAGLEVRDGRFRHVFDDNIRDLAAKVVVHDGDITLTEWTEGPIEVLFIDICKSWQLADYVMRAFFPKLIPGHSLVIQQDYFHNWEPWVALTMELLRDHFEFVSYVPINSAVFRLRKAIDPSALPPRLRDMGLETLATMLRRRIEEHGEPFQKAMLSTALSQLYLDFGDGERAAAMGREALVLSQDHWVKTAIAEMQLVL